MEKPLGIVFTGGEGPAPEITKRLLQGLAEPPLLAAADSGLILAENAGFRPDWIVGDMDSLRDQSRLHSYPSGRIVRHAVDKNHTDTELALHLLWEKGCGDTWIIGGGGGRIGHIFAIRDLFERECFPCRWITAAEDIYCIHGSIDEIDAAGATNDTSRSSLTLTLEQGNLVSVFSMGDGPWKAESQGLKWPLGNIRWERGLYGLSNVAVEESITVNAIQGRFIIILEEIWQR